MKHSNQYQSGYRHKSKFHQIHIIHLLVILRLISDDLHLQQRFILFIAMLGKEQEQLMMERYVYASRTACLRNRIAISYHQNSKHKSLPNMVFISVYFSLYLPFYFFPFYLSKVFLPFSKRLQV